MWEGHTDYKVILNKIQEVYRFELERFKHTEEECTVRINRLFKEQSRTRIGLFQDFNVPKMSPLYKNQKSDRFDTQKSMKY